MRMYIFKVELDCFIFCFFHLRLHCMYLFHNTSIKNKIEQKIACVPFSKVTFSDIFTHKHIQTYALVVMFSNVFLNVGYGEKK